jgi:hypothetical protein
VAGCEGKRVIFVLRSTLEQIQTIDAEDIVKITLEGVHVERTTQLVYRVVLDSI